MTETTTLVLEPYISDFNIDGFYLPDQLLGLIGLVMVLGLLRMLKERFIDE